MGLYGMLHAGFYGLLGIAAKSIFVVVDVVADTGKAIAVALERLSDIIQELKGVVPVSETGSEAPVAPDTPVPPEIGNEVLASRPPPPYKVYF